MRFAEDVVDGEICRLGLALTIGPHDNFVNEQSNDLSLNRPVVRRVHLIQTILQTSEKRTGLGQLGLGCFDKSSPGTERIR
jgi:hypothetical protein